jgi:hypothetical protein
MTTAPVKWQDASIAGAYYCDVRRRRKFFSQLSPVFEAREPKPFRITLARPHEAPNRSAFRIPRSAFESPNRLKTGLQTPLPHPVLDKSGFQPQDSASP